MKPIFIKSLEGYLKDQMIFDNEEIEAFLKLLKSRKFKKNDFLIREGEISTEMIFVSKGIFRTYFTPQPGIIITQSFTFEKNFLTSYQSFITQKESGENIQAVVHSEALVISRKDLHMLAEKFPGWTNFLKKYSVDQLMKMEKFLQRNYQENAESRYVRLIQNQPHYFQYLPLNHIASYLGITQRHLSRIRKGIMIKEMEQSKSLRNIPTSLN